MKVVEHIIMRCGGTKALAEHFGITRDAIRQWRLSGLPSSRALEIHEDFDLPLGVIKAARDPNATFPEPEQPAA